MVKFKKDRISLSTADVNDLLEYVTHDSWRCAYYQACHCGLDALTDKMGLRRVPIPERND